MVDKARGIIEPGSTSVVIPGVPAGASLTVTAYAEDVYGQTSAPASDTVDTPAAQVTLTDPDNSIPVLTTNTDPSAGAVGAQPFLYNEWKRLIRNGDFHDPPPDPGSPINNTTNKLPGWIIVDFFLVPVDPNPATDGYIMWVPDVTTGSGARVDYHQLTGAFILMSDPAPVRSTSTRNNALVAIASASIDTQALPANDVTINVTEYDSTDSSADAAIGFPVIANKIFSGTSVIEDVVGIATLGTQAATQNIRAYAYIGHDNAVLSLYEIQVIELGPVVGGADVGNPANAPWTAIYDSGVLTIDADSVVIGGTHGFVATDSIWDAKGDLAAGTGANTAAKRTVGANDTILMADSTQTTGLKWANAATVKTALGYYTSGDSPSFAAITATGLVELQGRIQFAGTVNTSTATGNITALAVTDSTWRWNGASTATLCGVAGGAEGRAIRIHNIASVSLQIAHESGTEGTAANRIAVPGGSGNFPVGPGASIWLLYDDTSSRWRVVGVDSLRPGNNLADVNSVPTSLDNLTIQRKRVTVGASIAAGGTRTDTVTWDTAFADTNYTASVTPLQTNSTNDHCTCSIVSVAAGSIVVRTWNFDSAARQPTLHCIAIHD